jgi:hypothetical protein
LLALRCSFKDEALGGLDPAHELDNDVDVGIPHERPGISRQQLGFDLRSALGLQIAHGDTLDGERDADPLFEHLPILS